MNQVDQSRFNNQRSDFLTAKEAAALLGVKLATVYAYASRGRLRGTKNPRGRGHVYARGDVERLWARSAARAGHAPVAAGALRFGEPVLESSVTELTGVGHRYRGTSAIELANDDEPFETVAELLWTGSRGCDSSAWRAEGLGVRGASLAALVPEASPPIATLALIVPALALADPSRFRARDEAEHQRARTLLRRMAACLALGCDRSRLEPALEAPSLAASVAIALGAAPKRAVVRAIDRALVLSADHELNASTFAARVAASARADLYSCISAGLGALSGPRHGGMGARVEALVDEVGSPERAERVVNERARRGEEVPGFGHPLYPDGDPRYAPLAAVAEQCGRPRPKLRTLLAIVDAMRAGGRSEPTLDAGHAAVAFALGLPPGSAAAFFAIGRTAGWVAHVVEQRGSGFLLRPRARYVGR